MRWLGNIHPVAFASGLRCSGFGILALDKERTVRLGTFERDILHVGLADGIGALRRKSDA